LAGYMTAAGRQELSLATGSVLGSLNHCDGLAAWKTTPGHQRGDGYGK